MSEGRRKGKAGEEEGRTAGGSAQPKTRTPHNDVGKTHKSFNSFFKNMSLPSPTIFPKCYTMKGDRGRKSNETAKQNLYCELQ